MNHRNQSKGTKVFTFLVEALLYALADRMHKKVHRGAHGRLWVMGLTFVNKKKVEELLCLLVFVLSPRSERWPR